MNMPLRFCLFLTVLGLCAGSGPAAASVRELWRQRDDRQISSVEDKAGGMVRDAAGHVIVAGYSGKDALVVKYSATTGAVLWEQRHRGGEFRRHGWAGVAVDAAGNVVVAGYFWNGADYDYHVAKYAAADGALLWRRQWDGPEQGDDHAVAVAVDAAGDVVVTGESGRDEYDGSPFLGDYLTQKYRGSDGALLWERRLAQPEGERQRTPAALRMDASGNVVLTGCAVSADGTERDRMYAAKFAAADGAVVWEWRGPLTAGWVWASRAVTVDAGGNVIVAGDAEGVDGTMDCYTAKLGAATGVPVWERLYHAPSGRNDTARAVAVDALGNVVVTGSSELQNAPPDAALLPDFYTAKYAAADGAVLWERRYDGPAHGTDEPTALTVDGAGNITVAGTSEGVVRGGVLDFYTAHYAGADGALLWERRYRSPGNGGDAVVALAAGSDGAVVVTGNSPSGVEPDIYTASYAAADGAVRWERRTAGLAPATGSGRAVAVDSAGNVVAAGTADGDDTDVDFLTAKYSPSGVLLWERRYDGPGSGRDILTAMALGAAGNVIVTGQSDAGGQQYDFYTAKYAAADGALLWERRYNGPGNATDYPTALTVDAGGNVVVTGPSTGTGGPFPAYDFYTAKYAAADGALLWERRGGRGYPYAVAADAAGNVAVTGSVWRGASLGEGRYTVKYAAATGAVLWESTSAEAGRNEAFAITADSAGDVIVTGYASGAIRTEKFAAADGTPRWAKSHSAGIGWAVAVDGADNVVIAAGTPGNESETIKYAAADGALLWSQRSTARRSGDFLALDAAGNAVVSGWAADGGFSAKYRAADGAVVWDMPYDIATPSGIVPGGAALRADGSVVVTGRNARPEDDGVFTTAVFHYVPPPASFAEWAAGYGLSGAAAAADADPDGDGMPSALEFLYGTSPAARDALQQPVVTRVDDLLHLTFRRTAESATPDVHCTVETGTDLLTWPQVFAIGTTSESSSPGVTVTADGDGWDNITVRLPEGTAGRLFVRLRVTVTP